MRVLFFGSRDYDNSTAIQDELVRLKARYGAALTIIHGDARGADALACEWCDRLNIPHEMYYAGYITYNETTLLSIFKPSDWNKDGKRAGALRNQAMLDSGVQGGVGFRCAGKSNGTDDMARRLVAANVPLIKRGAW